MMFLDCPAYLDEKGARRCGLPAEVEDQCTMRSTDGPIEMLRIRCPAGRWFNAPTDPLSCRHPPLFPVRLSRPWLPLVPDRAGASLTVPSGGKTRKRSKDTAGPGALQTPLARSGAGCLTTWRRRARCLSCSVARQATGSRPARP